MVGLGATPSARAFRLKHTCGTRLYPYRDL